MEDNIQRPHFGMPIPDVKLLSRAPKIAYKGFNKNLMCRNEQFEVGQTYTKENPKPKPQLCSRDGWHFAYNILDCFTTYNYVNGKNQTENRYCEIDVIGNETTDSWQGVTTCFKIIRELSREEIDAMRVVAAIAKQDSRFELPLIRSLQKQYPYMQVTGSVGLYLHGLKLKRWENSSPGDLDLIVPFYTLIEETDDIHTELCDDQEDRSDTNDFQQVIYVNGIKADIRIDPKQRYEIIEYNGHKYRVSILEQIMEAKFRYALSGNQKHKSDCYEICGKTKTNPVPTPIKDDLDLLF